MNTFKVACMVCLLAIVASCTKYDESSDWEISSDVEQANLKSADLVKGYVVVLKSESIAETGFESRKLKVKGRALGLLKQAGVDESQLTYVYGKALQGFAVNMAPGQLKKLQENDDVSYIEEDQTFSIINNKGRGKPSDTTPPAEATPWGITRVGGGIASTGTAWIIDTGIDLDHPDLNVDASRSACFLNSKKLTPDDQNGHGTHVAGTIAAIDNQIGVIGVAAGATVVAVRVLDRNGSGSLSGVIAGVDYVAANASPGDVANMSLGGSLTTALDDAVLNASSGGVQFVLAAGNSSTDADNFSPARVNGANVYTVSAMDNNDQFAYFSNYGAAVDFAAPGVDIYSCYKGGAYATMSGTSMAAPHVSGLLLIGAINADGYVGNDPDGNPDPIAHH